MTDLPLLFFPYSILCILLTFILAGRKATLIKTGERVAISLMALTVFYFFYIVISFSTSFAFIDDFNLLDSFQRMLYSEEPIDKVKAFFKQVNEHRFAFERILMYLIFKVHGLPDPKVQIIIGNLFIGGMAWLFYRFFKQSGQPMIYFVPVVMILFSLIYYENAYWAIAAIQNTPLIFFAMLTVWLLSKETRAGNTYSLISAVTTSFISGSGLSVWIIGIIILLVGKRYRFLVFWILTAMAVGVFYFTFDYTMYPRDRSNLWHHPFVNVSFFFSFLGSVLYGDFHHGLEWRFYPDTAASVLLGAILFIVCLRWFLESFLNRIEKHRQALTFLSGSMLFLMATGAMLVVSRPVSVNVLFGGENISQRYLIFSAVLCSSVYLALLYLYRTSGRRSRRVFLVFLFSSMALNLASYYRHIPSLAEHKASLELDKLYTDSFDMLLTSGERFGEKLFWNHPTAFPELLKNLAKTGLYNPKQKFDSAILDRAKQPADGSHWAVTTSIEESIGFAGRRNPIVYLSAAGPYRPRLKYFILQSAQHQFVLPAVPERALPLEMLTNMNYWSDRYSTEFRYFKFPPALYRILVVTDEREPVPRDTGKTLRLSEGAEGVEKQSKTEKKTAEPPF